MKAPSISVCIPVFNNRNSIRGSIKSILSQDYRDFEIIVSDNHSDDGTYEELKRIKDKRLRIFRNPKNIGWRLNSNKALSLAKGKYVVTLHADDYFRQGYFRKVVQIFEKNTAIGSIHFISNAEKAKYFGNKRLICADEYYSKIASLRMVPHPIKTAYRREAIINSEYYEKDYWTGEARLAMNIAEKGYPVYIEGETYVDMAKEKKWGDSQRTENVILMFENTYDFLKELTGDKKITKRDMNLLKESVIRAFLLLYRYYINRKEPELKKALADAGRKINKSDEFEKFRLKIFFGKIEVRIRILIKNTLTKLNISH
ncbi:MAG: glycosyltransferase family 2 protein [Candidatus Woesearchaeota archaeon]|nr:glycosyltransferase family 2 protein [Candidatus Woesearchaeota archaeon]